MEKINKIIELQRKFFSTGKTKNIKYRIMQLKILKQAIIGYENEILRALKLDLNKTNFEAYETEIGIVIKELNYTIKNLEKWSKPESKNISLEHFPSKGTIFYEPYGLALIIAPWNYPFQLIFSPLIGAIAAGNCVVVKPSEYTRHTAELIYEIITAHFDESFVSCFQGGREVNEYLLKKKFDYIFFTGSTAVGKIVMRAAAENLTPLTLELGGKSPCIVDENIDLSTTSKRIVWGKFINGGQTCVAPDYILVKNSIKKELIDNLIKSIISMYGKNVFSSSDYVKIVNNKHFERLKGLMVGENIVYGGLSNEENLIIEPTLLDSPKWDSQVMQEEIFGPILPIIGFDSIDEMIRIINERPKPLALYLFTNDKELENKVISSISFGGGCINDTIVHIGPTNLPFGGVGESGMGSYHGKYSFLTFSHEKSILKKSLNIDIPIRYPPYKKNIKVLKKILK